MTNAPITYLSIARAWFTGIYPFPQEPVALRRSVRWQADHSELDAGADRLRKGDRRAGRRRIGNRPAAQERRIIPANLDGLRRKLVDSVAEAVSQTAGRSTLLITSRTASLSLSGQTSGADASRSRDINPRRGPSPRFADALFFQRIHSLAHTRRVRQLHRPAVNSDSRRRHIAVVPGVGETILR